MTNPRISSVLLSSLCATALVSGGCTLSFTSTPPDAPPPVEVQADIPPTEIVAETDVAPVEVEEFYFIGGRYYYWHPGYGRYVKLRGEPPSGHRVFRRDSLPNNHAPRPPSHPPSKPPPKTKKPNQ